MIIDDENLTDSQQAHNTNQCTDSCYCIQKVYVVYLCGLHSMQASIHAWSVHEHLMDKSFLTEASMPRNSRGCMVKKATTITSRPRSDTPVSRLR